MPNDTDLLIRLLMEDHFSKELERAAAHFEERMKKAASVKELQSLERQWNEVRTEIEETEKAAKKAQQEQERLTRAQAQAAKEQAAAQQQVLRSQAALLANQVTQMRARSAEMARLSGVVGNASRTAGIAGGLIVGGAFAEVNRYVANAKEATAVTRAWAAEQEKLAAARARIDEVLAREALPMLKLAARYANEAAAFVEQHPEVVDAVLKTGAILVGLGTIGSLVSKGLKMKADALYLASVPVQLQAAELQALAARNQLAAASMNANMTGVTAGGATAARGTSTGALRIVGTVTLVASSVLLGAELGNSLGNAIAKLIDPTSKDMTLKETVFYGGVRPLEAIAQQIQAAEKGFLQWLSLTEAGDQNLEKIFGKAGDIIQAQDKFFQKLFLGLDEATQKAEEFSGAMPTTQLAGSANEEAVVSAYMQWREDDARMIREAAAERVKIIADAEKQIADATRRYAQQRSTINQQYNDNRAEIIETFNETSRQAEINYARSRAEIIQSAGEEIQRIEEQHQDNIRKMTLDHRERVDELTAARDALGLVKQQRQFDRSVAEAERETNQEIARRRRETAVRLADLASQFAQERAQRQAEYLQSLADNEVRRQEELKQAAEAHAEELRQAREASAQKLRELQEALNAERLRRRETFIAEIRDLDAGLLGERNLKRQYYGLMLQDAETWLATYRAKLASLSTTAPTSQAAGGYAAYGIYRLGDTTSGGPGPAEFVLSGSTTRAAEQLIGGQLSQRSILSAMMGGGGRSITWNDHRRFDGRITVAERRAILEDTKAVIYQEMGL